jgi:Uma2 family endonuclease
VVCGEPRYAANDPPEMSLTNPLLLVEVLSPSTQDYDRGEKLTQYKRISSLREVLLVWTERRLIEQHVREEAGWRQVDHATGAFLVPSLGGTLSVEAIYGALVP